VFSLQSELSKLRLHNAVEDPSAHDRGRLYGEGQGLGAAPRGARSGVAGARWVPHFTHAVPPTADVLHCGFEHGEGDYSILPVRPSRFVTWGCT